MTYQRKEVIGRATLYLGDCREILPTLGTFDAVVADPPYSSGGFQEAGKSGGSLTGRHRERGQSIALDNLSTRGYQRLLREVLSPLSGCDEAYLFTDWRMWVYTTDALEDAGFRVRNMLVWDKCQMGMGMPWRNQHELVAFGKRTPAKIMDGKLGNVLRFKRSGNKNHPTEKPTDLMSCLIGNSPAESIIDPFMGSGSTGVSAIELGRSFTGIEADLDHFETAYKRIEDAQRQGNLFQEP